MAKVSLGQTVYGAHATQHDTAWRLPTATEMNQSGAAWGETREWA